MNEEKCLFYVSSPIERNGIESGQKSEENRGERERERRERKRKERGNKIVEMVTIGP